jgi:hypothetical protein
MFRSAPSAERSLAPIAEVLFRELFTFGQLAYGKLEEYSLDRYISRADFTLWYLDALESVADLRFGKHEIVAFVANTNRWRTSAPVGGWTGTAEDPLPSHVAVSLLGSLRLAATSKSAFLRLLRAAVSVVNRSGLEAAVSLVTDLYVYGFLATSQDDVALVLAVLFGGRSKVPDDPTLVRRLCDNVVPQTPQEWLDARFNLDWIDLQDPSSWHLPEIGPLIAKGLNEVDKVRNSPSWDEWVLGHYRLRRLLGVIKIITDSPSATIPFGMTAVLSQLEEIRADCLSFMGSLISALGVNDLRAWTVLFERNSYIQNLVGRPEIGQRILKERLLVPRPFEGHASAMNAVPLPRHWSYLSWKVAHPVTALLGTIPDITFATLEPPNPDSTSLPEESIGVNAARRLMPRAHALERELNEVRRFSDDGQFDESVNKCNALLQDYPWSDSVRWELAIALDQLGNSERALEQMVPAIVLRPGNWRAWQSLSVILNRLKAPEEARLASGFGSYLQAYPRAFSRR